MIGDGNGWLDGPNGARLWGKYGAAGVFLLAGSRVLLQHRAEWTANGGTWALPGGARDSHETVEEAALREAVEECSIDTDRVHVFHSLVTAGPFESGWSYTTVLARTVDGEPIPTEADEESLELRWVELENIRELPLLPAFERSLETILWHCSNHD
ncbi:NUDIX hydrolase [Corynebacterium breve]|uniref:NUDIX hydrolase n=1 Tax=Corynebacterium breve TaxID=3049799 RepID=A0ABY8VD38_9CORY|nr:NUDIX hydrolase [Corynebacterium breve]WIM67408.1 NUDIX hydrolase [Corynebacterium breve]